MQEPGSQRDAYPWWICASYAWATLPARAEGLTPARSDKQSGSEALPAALAAYLNVDEKLDVGMVLVTDQHCQGTCRPQK